MKKNQVNQMLSQVDEKYISEILESESTQAEYSDEISGEVQVVSHITHWKTWTAMVAVVAVCAGLGTAVLHPMLQRSQLHVNSTVEMEEISDSSELSEEEFQAILETSDILAENSESDSDTIAEFAETIAEPLESDTTISDISIEEQQQQQNVNLEESQEEFNQESEYIPTTELTVVHSLDELSELYADNFWENIIPEKSQTDNLTFQEFDIVSKYDADGNFTGDIDVEAIYQGENDARLSCYFSKDIGETEATPININSTLHIEPYLFEHFEILLDCHGWYAHIYADNCSSGNISTYIQTIKHRCIRKETPIMN